MSDSIILKHQQVVQRHRFFFLSEIFLTDTDDSLESKGREWTIFIPLYNFHFLTNIRTFICNFSVEVTAMYF